MIMEKENNKSSSVLKSYGILILMLLLIFTVLVYFISISRKSWESGLKTCVENVLEEKYGNEWTVGDFVQIDNPIAVNAACYRIKNSEGINGRAVIIKIATYYGPVSAVYISTGESVSFVGFSSLHGRIAETMMSNKKDKKILYWQDKIPQIIK